MKERQEKQTCMCRTYYDPDTEQTAIMSSHCPLHKGVIMEWDDEEEEHAQGVINELFGNN